MPAHKIRAEVLAGIEDANLRVPAIQSFANEKNGANGNSAKPFHEGGSLVYIALQPHS